MWNLIWYSKGSSTTLERFFFNLVHCTVQPAASRALGDPVNSGKGKERARLGSKHVGEESMWLSEAGDVKMIC